MHPLQIRRTSLHVLRAGQQQLRATMPPCRRKRNLPESVLRCNGRWTCNQAVAKRPQTGHREASSPRTSRAPTKSTKEAGTTYLITLASSFTTELESTPSPAEATALQASNLETSSTNSDFRMAIKFPRLTAAGFALTRTHGARTTISTVLRLFASWSPDLAVQSA